MNNVKLLSPTYPFPNRDCCFSFIWAMSISIYVGSVNGTKQVGACSSKTSLNPWNAKNTEDVGESCTVMNLMQAFYFFILWIDLSAHAAFFRIENKHTNQLRWPKTSIFSPITMCFISVALIGWCLYSVPRMFKIKHSSIFPQILCFCVFMWSYVHTEAPFSGIYYII